ncbi:MULTISPECIES: hypothetical protein [unclassified Streptomyces]|uniref:hypothetical protein n=1 Tax=unclassified Streptomyces TaxID=2593676 RepID=UPI00037E58FB|nr:MULTISPECIES: hypothetical protein [unclassified Streptomyces]MYY02695.1 hypothetical protein [Streptomyces sp. SID4913]
MAPQIAGPITQSFDQTVLSAALEEVQSDSPSQQSFIESNVQAALTDGNSCMMGGWAS